MGTSISLAAVGDLAPLWPLPDHTTTAPAWEPLRRADVAMANLELPLTTRTTGGIKAFNLRADPNVAPSLRACGVGLVSVANNHACDYGPDALLDTMHACRAAGVACVGGGRDLDEAFAPVIHEVGGLRVAVLGMACTLPPGFAAGPRRPGIAGIRVQTRFFLDTPTLAEQPGAVPWVETRIDDDDLTPATTAVAQARTHADLVVVQIHWGVPHGWTGAFQGPLADYQRPLGHALIAAGADLILGHHPHVIHGVEHHHHGSRHGVIVYSLGHWLFHALGDQAELHPANTYPTYDMSSVSTGPARDTVVFTASADTGGLIDARLTPARLDPHGEPVLPTGTQATTVLDRLVESSMRLGTSPTLRDGTAIIELPRPSQR